MTFEPCFLNKGNRSELIKKLCKIELLYTVCKTYINIKKIRIFAKKYLFADVPHVYC